jgi:hypothetical protein
VRPGVKLAAFAVVLAAAFGVGAVVGSVAGPIEVSEPTHSVDMTEHPAGHETP